MASEPLPSTAPPAYTEKEDEGQQVQQPSGVTAFPPSAYAYTYPVGTAIPGAAIPVQYMIPSAQSPGSGAGFRATAPPQKSHPAPHNFLMLTLITTVVCGMLNVLSLALGVPALILATMSASAKRSGNYPKAKKYADLALALVISNIIVTLCISLLVTGLINTLPTFVDGIASIIKSGTQI